MAIIMEDGTGLANANSFISVAGADAYWTEVTMPALWASASNSEKEAALVQATRYMEKRFGTRYKGSRQQEFPPMSAVEAIQAYQRRELEKRAEARGASAVLTKSPLDMSLTARRRPRGIAQ